MKKDQRAWLTDSAMAVLTSPLTKSFLDESGEV